MIEAIDIIHDSEIEIMKRSFSDDLAKSRVENLLKPLSNPIRLRILYELGEKSCTYTELLEKLGLESGSFYWHVKKMRALIEQTVDKRYQLNDVGRSAYQLIFMGSMKKDKEYVPRWFETTLGYSKRILDTSNWLLTQQILLIFLFTTLLYESRGLYQFGTRVLYDPNFGFVERFGSILLSLLVINSIEIGVILIGKLLFDKENPRIPLKPLARLFILNFMFLSPILITGIVSGLIVFIYPTIVDEMTIQIALNFITIFASVLLCSALLVIEFDFSFRIALITGLVTFYPVVFISFIL